MLKTSMDIMSRPSELAYFRLINRESAFFVDSNNRIFQVDPSGEFWIMAGDNMLYTDEEISFPVEVLSKNTDAPF